MQNMSRTTVKAKGLMVQWQRPLAGELPPSGFNPWVLHNLWKKNPLAGLTGYVY
jgi:hypothetical protein